MPLEGCAVGERVFNQTYSDLCCLMAARNFCGTAVSCIAASSFIVSECFVTLWVQCHVGIQWNPTAPSRTAYVFFGVAIHWGGVRAESQGI